MIRVTALFMASILLMLPLSGCYDARELDSQAYVVVIGFDKGKKNPLLISLQLRKLAKTSGDSTTGGNNSSGEGGSDKDEKKGDQKSMILISTECKTFFQGLEFLNKATTRRINLMHAKVIVFSEEFAREGVGRYMGAITRYPDVRKITRVIVTKGDARDFMKVNTSVIGSAPFKSMDLLTQQAYYLSTFPVVNLGEFYNDIKNTYFQPLVPYAAVNDLNLNDKDSLPADTDYGVMAGDEPRTGGSQRSLAGSAVFDGDRMMGALNVDETRAVLAVRGELTNSFVSIKDPLHPDYEVVFLVSQDEKTKVDVDISRGYPVIKCKVYLEGNIYAIQSGENYENIKKIGILEKAFNDRFKEILDKTVAKCRDEYKSDVFKFGTHVVWNFSTIKEWEKYNWIKQFTNARVETEVDFKIRRSGLIQKFSPIISVERGKELPEGEK